MHWKLDTWRI